MQIHSKLFVSNLHLINIDVNSGIFLRILMSTQNFLLASNILVTFEKKINIIILLFI